MHEWKAHGVQNKVRPDKFVPAAEPALGAAVAEWREKLGLRPPERAGLPALEERPGVRQEAGIVRNRPPAVDSIRPKQRSNQAGRAVHRRSFGRFELKQRLSG